MKFQHVVWVLLVAGNVAYAAETTEPPKPVIVDVGGNLKVVTPQTKDTTTTPSKPVEPAKSKQIVSPLTTQSPNGQTQPPQGTPMPSMEGITPGTTPGGYIQDAPK